MTFQQVLNMIRDTANHAEVNQTGTFVHGRNSDAANAQGLPYPRIHLYPFIQEIDPLETHRRSSDLLLSFVEADDGSQDEAKREEIIARMGALVDSFVSQLTEDYENDVQFSSIRTEPQYQILEGVSGYTLSLKITTLTGC